MPDSLITGLIVGGVPLAIIVLAVFLDKIPPVFGRQKLEPVK